MVSSASRLYDWQASRLGSPRMGAPRRTDSDASQPDTLRQRTPSHSLVRCARAERPYPTLAHMQSPKQLRVLLAHRFRQMSVGSALR